MREGEAALPLVDTGAAALDTGGGALGSPAAGGEGLVVDSPVAVAGGEEAAGVRGPEADRPGGEPPEETEAQPERVDPTPEEAAAGGVEGARAV